MTADSRIRGRSTVWFIGVATAFSLLGDQTLYSTLPVIFEDLGLRPIEVGIILSANRWVRMATNELAHRMTGAGPQRLLFVAAVTAGAATTAVYATSPGFALFIAARLGWGLCWSFIRHLGLLSVMGVDGGARSGHSAGRLSGISRAGSVAGLLGGAVLVDRLGFGPALAVLAGVSAGAIPFAWFGFVPFVDRVRSAGGDRGGSRVAPLLGFAHGMVGPGLVMATLGAVLDQRVDRGGWFSAATLTGAVLALRFVVESGAAARLGSISDRHGVGSTCAVAFAVGGSALVVAALSAWLVVLIVAVVVFFITGTTLGAGLSGFAGASGSRALARYATAGDLGSACGPLVGWIALDLFDQRTIGLGIGAVIYGLASLLAWRFLGRAQAVTARE